MRAICRIHFDCGCFLFFSFESGGGGRRALAERVYALYQPQFRSPVWTAESFATDFDRYAPAARLVVDAGDDVELARRFCREREPVPGRVCGIPKRLDVQTGRLHTHTHSGLSRPT